MNAQLIEEILDELDPIFQSTGTSAGIVRLLKDKGIVNDDDLAPYLEQAATAGSIKWRATRLRLERILKSAVKSIEDELSEKQKKALEEAKAAANICPPRIRRKQQTTEVKQGVNRDEQKQGAMHASQTKTSEANASGTSQNESAITFDAKTPAAQPPDNGSGKQAAA